MKQIIIVLFFILFGNMFVYSGGKAEPFTKKILNNFTIDELKHAQFYLDKPLTLFRIVPSGEKKV